MKSMFSKSMAAIIIFSSCQKMVDLSIPSTSTPVTNSGMITYTIPKGENYCDKSSYQTVNYSELKFKAKFDSSAVYTTTAKGNQGDINKLYGFSDNNALHQNYSARFGWRWYNNNLEIFAYVYNEGSVSMQKIANAPINQTYLYSIKVNEGSYTFSFNDTKVAMPRSSTTSTAIGYKLYPYFGGTETAPHEIKIQIEEMQL